MTPLLLYAMSVNRKEMDPVAVERGYDVPIPASYRQYGNNYRGMSWVNLTVGKHLPLFFRLQLESWYRQRKGDNKANFISGMYQELSATSIPPNIVFRPDDMKFMEKRLTYTTKGDPHQSANFIRTAQANHRQGYVVLLAIADPER